MPKVEVVLAEVRATRDALQRVQRTEAQARQRHYRTIRKAHAAGVSYQQIADVIGVTRAYIYEICREE